MSSDLIIEAIAYLIENAAFFFILDRLFKRRYNVLTTIAAVLIATIVDTLAFNLPVWLRASVFVVVCIPLCIAVYTIKPYIASALCIMFGYIECIVNLLVGILLSVCYDEYILTIFRGFTSQHIISHILAEAAVIGLLFYFAHIQRKLSPEYGLQFWKIFNILIITFFIISVMFMTAYPVTSPSSVAEYIYVITTAMFFVLTIVIIRLSITVSDKRRQADKLRTIRDTFENLEEAYYVQLDAITATRKMRHDMKAHISAVTALIRQNNVEEAISVLHEFCANLELPSAKIEELTGNIYVDIILSNKLALFRQHDINFEYELDFLNDVHIENIDITSVVSNLLDNAYEAASVSEKKYIRFQLMDYDSHIFIRTLNSYAIEPISSSVLGSVLNSTKKDPGVHGLGMEIIRDLADKYNGSFIWNIHDGLFDAYVTMAKDIYDTTKDSK